jgi:hypothetical protein
MTYETSCFAPDQFDRPRPASTARRFADLLMDEAVASDLGDMMYEVELGDSQINVYIMVDGCVVEGSDDWLR